MQVLQSEIRCKDVPLPSGYFDNKLRDPPIGNVTYPKDHFLEETDIENQFRCLVCNSIYCFAIIDDNGKFHPNGWILPDGRWTMFEPSCNIFGELKSGK